MTTNNCPQRISCGFLAVVSSLIIGIITAFLSITGTITLTPAFLWVTLGIGVGYIAILLIASAIKGHGCECSCGAASTLLTGALGTALFSLVLLAITFAEASLTLAIITGILLFFLSLTLTSAACLIKCIYCNHD